MARVLVTVGMSRWPFDRLVRHLHTVCERHEVFAQIGCARDEPPCSHARYLPMPELLERMRRADVVVTHAGNSVRVAQRLGTVPIAVARDPKLGEAANGHQIDYLRAEERDGRVVPLWDVADLARAVDEHPARAQRILDERSLPAPVAPAEVQHTLDALCRRLLDDPFARHHHRRWSYAWRTLAERSGRHLDVGCQSGEFVRTLARTSALECHAVDAHPGYVQALRQVAPELQVRQVQIRGPLPYPDGWFDSVSLLDVLEHVPSDAAMLREVQRVLAPGGLAVVTVPRRHVLSPLDPDNVKVRWPRLHRAVYTRSFGAEVYHERFVDRSNGLAGEMSLGRAEHTNYPRGRLLGLLETAGLEPVDVDGANLFWLLFATPALVLDGRPRRLLERAVALDGRLFRSANLFVTARRAL